MTTCVPGCFLLLDKLEAIPMQTWNYKSQDDSIRHMGPMAQDFYAAFGLGEDNKHINTVDADGVALAGVQALYRMLQEKDAQLAALRKDNESMKAELSDLRAVIGTVQRRLGVEVSQAVVSGK